MIPAIMRKEVPRLMPAADAGEATRQAEKESAAIIGFTSAIAAYGAFFIPKAFGTSIAMTGGRRPRCGGSSLLRQLPALTWFVYTRRAAAARHRAWSPQVPVAQPRRHEGADP
jgi:NNP family nitrate/nitrite transporter-like MFS transporter